MKDDRTFLDAEPPLPRRIDRPWPRLVAGLLASVAFALALHDLGTAGLQLIGSDSPAASWWAEPRWRALVQVGLGVAAAAGAFVAGAGQLRGLLWGGLLGFGNAMIVGALIAGTRVPHNDTLLLTLPIYQTLCGCLGAWLGMRVYPPLELLEMQIASKMVPAEPEKLLVKRPAEPFSWAKIVAGAAWIAFGTVFAEAFRDLIIMIGGTRGSEALQNAWFTGVVVILVILIGGFIAGFSTRKGLGNGAVAGMIGGLIVLVQVLATRGQQTTATSAADLFNVSSKDGVGMLAALLFVEVVSLALFGGWLGQHLLPPTVAARRSRATSHTN